MDVLIFISSFIIINLVLLLSIYKDYLNLLTFMINLMEN